MSEHFVPTGALKLSHPVGREDEQAKITYAINDDKRSHIIYLIGSGGIGKSMLLERVPQWRAKCVCPPIVDLYAVNTNSAVESAIVTSLGARHFRRYLAAREEFEPRLEDLDPAIVAEKGDQLKRIFIQDFNGFTKNHRVILRLDTVENVQFERRQIEAAYRISPPEIELKAWLLLVLPLLQNTVTILAGRPHPELEASLKKTLKKRLTIIRLKELGLAGTLEYFEQMEREAQNRPNMHQVADALLRLPVDIRRTMHKYTRGNPILLALFIDWLTQRGPRKMTGLPLDLFGKIPFDPKEVARLSAKEIGEIQDQVQKSLVQRLTRDLAAPLPATLRTLGYARKGMDEELFKQIHGRGLTRKEFDGLKKSLMQLSFVKIREYPQIRFSLHDRIYELFAKYNFVKEAGGDKLFDQLVEYSQKQKDVPNAVQVRLDELTVEQLYYELVRDARNGLTQFLDWDEQAIRQQRRGYDMRLRDEVARFAREHEASWHVPDIEPLWIERDAALRWIRRYYVEKDYNHALAFIGALKKEHALFPPRDPLLELYEGIVKAQASRNLKHTTESLRQNIKQVHSNGNPFIDWQINLARAEAYNALGYALTQLKKYRGAIEAFTEAIKYQRQIGSSLRPVEADTLNNRAYVYSFQGDYRVALSDVEDGRRIRENELKHKYATALSYNVMGLIYKFDRKPDQALGYCLNALQLAQDAESERGQGFALNALGMIYRDLANQQKHDLPQATTHFKEAEGSLQKAIALWTKRKEEGNAEPFSEVEAYNELGCTYRDRGMLLMENRRRAAAKRYLSLGERYLQLGIQRLTPDLKAEYADALEDLAEIYEVRGQEQKALKTLQEAEKHIPTEYRLGRIGFRSIEDPVNGYWLMLAKINWRRAQIFFKQEPDISMRHYVQAVAYAVQSSSQGTLIDIIADDLAEKLKDLPSDLRDKGRVSIVAEIKRLGLDNRRVSDALGVVI